MKEKRREERRERGGKDKESRGEGGEGVGRQDVIKEEKKEKSK